MNLITDRTVADAQRKRELAAIGYDDMTADEKTEWNAGLKGAYNAADLNRVGQACADLYTALTGAGYAVSGYVALKTDWTNSDRPTKAQLTTYLSTVSAIKAVLPAVTDLPSTMKSLTYEGANNIEKLLVEVDDILNRIIAVYVRSGEWNSGNVFHIKATHLLNTAIWQQISNNLTQSQAVIPSCSTLSPTRAEFTWKALVQSHWTSVLTAQHSKASLTQ